jgi:hypothetical protein
MKEDQCGYPRCRYESAVGLYGVFGLCWRHWKRYCEIEPEDDSFEPTKVLRHEKQRLQFQAKCGSRDAIKGLKQMGADLDNYTMRHTYMNGKAGLSVAEYRVAFAKWRAEKDGKTLEEAEEEIVDEPAPVEAVAGEPAEDDDEFGGIGEFL